MNLSDKLNDNNFATIKEIDKIILFQIYLSQKIIKLINEIN